MLLLQLAAGERIETTPEHPFYVEGRGFVRAAELGIGTSIVTRAGPSLQILAAQLKDAPATVYNLEVADFHTYFVGSAGAWVHNWCNLPTNGTVIQEEMQVFRVDEAGNILLGEPGGDFDRIERIGDELWIISVKDKTSGNIETIARESRRSLGDYETMLKDRMTIAEGVPNREAKLALLDELYDPTGSKLASGKIRIGLHITHPAPPNGLTEKIEREVSGWETSRKLNVGVKVETRSVP